MSNQQRIERLESLLQRIHRNAPDAARPIDLPDRSPGDAAPNPAVLAYKQKLELRRASVAAAAPVVHHRPPPPGMVVKSSAKAPARPPPAAQPAPQAAAPRVAPQPTAPQPRIVAQIQQPAPKPVAQQPRPAVAPLQPKPAPTTSAPLASPKPAISPLYQPRPATSQTQPSLQPIRPQPQAPAFSALATPKPAPAIAPIAPAASASPSSPPQELPRQKSRTATLLMGNAAAMGLVPPPQSSMPATQPPPGVAPAVRALDPVDETEEPATIVAMVNYPAVRAEREPAPHEISPPSEPTTVVAEVPTDQLQAIRAQAAAHLAQAQAPEWPPPAPGAGKPSRPQVNELFKETMAAPVSQRLADEMRDSDRGDRGGEADLFKDTVVRDVPADVVRDAREGAARAMAAENARARGPMDFKATVAGDVDLPPQAYPEEPPTPLVYPEEAAAAVLQHRVVNIGGGDMPPPPLPPPPQTALATPPPQLAPAAQVAQQAAPAPPPAWQNEGAQLPPMKPLPQTNLPQRMRSGAPAAAPKKKSRVGLVILVIFLLLLLAAGGAIAAQQYGLIQLPFKIPIPGLK